VNERLMEKDKKQNLPRRTARPVDGCHFNHDEHGKWSTNFRAEKKIPQGIQIGSLITNRDILVNTQNQGEEDEGLSYQ